MWCAKCLNDIWRIPISCSIKVFADTSKRRVLGMRSSYVRRRACSLEVYGGREKER